MGRAMSNASMEGNRVENVVGHWESDGGSWKSRLSLIRLLCEF
jgi:hypothetical protein